MVAVVVLRHLPFNFSLLSSPWDACVIAKLIGEYESHLPHGGWPNWVPGNHDRPRIATRVDAAQARIAAMLLLTLRGTPTILAKVFLRISSHAIA